MGPNLGWVVLCQSCVFFKDLSEYISLYDPILSGPSIAPTSQVHVSATLVLPIVGNWKLWAQSSIKWHNVHTKAQRNPSVVLELNHADRQTWSALYAFISRMSCKECTKSFKNQGTKKKNIFHELCASITFFSYQAMQI
jgi:hypothetical protein